MAGPGVDPMKHGTHFSRAQTFEKLYQFIQHNPGQLLKTPHPGKELSTQCPEEMVAQTVLNLSGPAVYSQ